MNTSFMENVKLLKWRILKFVIFEDAKLMNLNFSAFIFSWWWKGVRVPFEHISEFQYICEHVSCTHYMFCQ